MSKPSWYVETSKCSSVVVEALKVGRVLFSWGCEVELVDTTHGVMEVGIMKTWGKLIITHTNTSSCTYIHIIHWFCSRAKLARIPWATGKFFHLGCCGCPYCLLRSCVLAVSEIQNVLWNVVKVFDSSYVILLTFEKLWNGLAREWLDVGLNVKST